MEELKRALNAAVYERFMKGTGSECIRDHRIAVLHDVANFLELQVSNNDEAHQELLTFMNIEISPLDLSDWSRRFSKWARRNPRSLRDPKLYKILGVDGFDGTDDLGKYLPNVVQVLNSNHKRHVLAVRKMYDWIHSLFPTLVGPAVGHVVYWAMLYFYSDRLELYDDRVRSMLLKALIHASETIYANVEYFEDVRHVTEIVIEQLGKVYENEMTDPETWKHVAHTKLEKLLDGMKETKKKDSFKIVKI